MEMAFFNQSYYSSSPPVLNVICLKWPECRAGIETNSLNIANSSFALNSFWTTLFLFIYNFLLQVVIVDFRISLFSKPNNYSSAVVWDGSSKIFFPFVLSL
jgi:hypothetical protein